ncbi:Flagellar biosynthetic protein FlhB [Vibrio stylophorae]|uniref:Flagellar biosynthetic protein FlhB n=1 Tax=Vibrio stylophorae TaxID=659351 RepID=A0ABN8DW88_9VIBR|nr:flagellar biosynthesis protein FlhB [Vibrio stylophorae]CAH0534100.1 Flagellar biosynthetic protein FlhB [Vibrio stylophorae]
MAESDGQERTEDASARRLQQAREKGQVPRSRELASVAVMVAGALALMWFGQSIGEGLAAVMRRLFSLSRDEVFDFPKLLNILFQALGSLLIPMSIVLILLFIAGFIGASGLGGISFSTEAAMPKMSKMNPLTGVKRMFGKQSLVELLKSILKVALVVGVAYSLITDSVEEFFLLNREHYPSNVYHALDMLMDFVLLICCSLLIVVAIDVPFQIRQHNEQLKMTKQEVRDEYKETEGRPEVKGRIRQLQREMAQRRMMAEVPKADVVITNPEHYSVALRYDQSVDSAPIVIAKGIDHNAMKIREIAAQYDIPILPAPPLTRALYHTTELEQQIPDGLFVAVAQVLAYIYQLKQFQKGRAPRPKFDGQKIDIPKDMRY